MYCLSCGASLPDNALFCLKCGKLTTRGMSASKERESEDAATVAAAFLPADPYSTRASIPYGAQTTEPGPYAPPSPYTPLTPPPPPSPRRRRSTSGFVKGLISGILIVLLSAGIGTFLHLRQGAQSPSTPPPTAKSTVAAQPTAHVAPSPTATPQATVLYQADWSTGMDGWAGSPDWKVQNGMLISDGTNQPSGAAGPTILAPYQVAPSGNFAIEAKIQAPTNGAFDALLFHGSTTANGWQGYKLTVCGCKDLRITSDDFNDVLGRAPFIPDTNWHTYRVEVRGPAMTVIVDGKTLFTANDSRFLSGGQVGIKSSTQLTVSSFKITSL